MKHPVLQVLHFRESCKIKFLLIYNDFIASVPIHKNEFYSFLLKRTQIKSAFLTALPPCPK
jgi:hypothetical protein